MPAYFFLEFESGWAGRTYEEIGYVTVNEEPFTVSSPEILFGVSVTVGNPQALSSYVASPTAAVEIPEFNSAQITDAPLWAAQVATGLFSAEAPVSIHPAAIVNETPYVAVVDEAPYAAVVGLELHTAAVGASDNPTALISTVPLHSAQVAVGENTAEIGDPPRDFAIQAISSHPTGTSG